MKKITIKSGTISVYLFKWRIIIIIIKNQLLSQINHKYTKDKQKKWQSHDTILLSV